MVAVVEEKLKQEVEVAMERDKASMDFAAEWPMW